MLQYYEFPLPRQHSWAFVQDLEYFLIIEGKLYAHAAPYEIYLASEQALSLIMTQHNDLLSSEILLQVVRGYSDDPIIN